jgi:hypothetical protein
MHEEEKFRETTARLRALCDLLPLLTCPSGRAQFPEGKIAEPGETDLSEYAT